MRLLQSWLRALNFVRNVAAHHSRLWNKNLVDQPKLPRAGAVPAFDPVIGQPAVASRLFVMLCILLHMMRVVSPNSSWTARLRQLLDGFPAAPGLSLVDMGFPAGWEGHKTVAMFMHYVHTEDKPVRDAAELVANRRLAITGASRSMEATA